MVEIKAPLLRALVAVSVIIFSVHAVHAAEYVPYKVHMSRTSPGEPIRKSSIMDEVKARWPGRILHISSDSTGGKDCHTVKSMGEDGEFRIVRVACSN